MKAARSAAHAAGLAALLVLAGMPAHALTADEVYARVSPSV